MTDEKAASEIGAGGTAGKPDLHSTPPALKTQQLVPGTPGVFGNGSKGEAKTGFVEHLLKRPLKALPPLLLPPNSGLCLSQPQKRTKA